MCPLFVLVFVLLLVLGLAWSEALRSPQGGAFRAQRKARPTTGAAESELLSALSAAPRGGRPRATGDPPAAPTSVLRSKPECASARLWVPHREHSAWRAPESPATAACALDTRWPGRR